MNNEQLYIGFTPDLKKRMETHKSGRVFTTSKYLPVNLVHYECYRAKEDALNREKMLKRFGSTWSHLRKRIQKSAKF